jgi:hypothetical protein
VKLVINVGIWKIGAHIAFKFYPGASETFSTASNVAAQQRPSRPMQRFDRRRSYLRSSWKDTRLSSPLSSPAR